MSDITIITPTVLCKVDWYSFTFPTSSPYETCGEDTVADIMERLDRVLLGLWKPVIRGHGWEVQKGRGFYQHAIVDDDSKVRMSFGNVNPHVYVECSGQACSYLRSAGILNDLIELTGDRASRIDFAADFECDVKPQDFIVKAHCPAYKGRGFITSEQGDTFYIGSRKSKRMLRVYRYHAPHPRSHLLRCEAEYKGAAAKAAVKALLSNGEAVATQRALAPFGLQHELYLSANFETSKIVSKPSDRAGIGTWQWLEKQVKPALLKLAADEPQELQAWLRSIIEQTDAQHGTLDGFPMP